MNPYANVYPLWDSSIYSTQKSEKTKPTRPPDGRGDDKISLNEVPVQYRTLGRIGTLLGNTLQSKEGFVEKENFWDPQQTEGGSVVFSKYFVRGKESLDVWWLPRLS